MGAQVTVTGGQLFTWEDRAGCVPVHRKIRSVGELHHPVFDPDANHSGADGK
jgi:hypothetical protein